MTTTVRTRYKDKDVNDPEHPQAFRDLSQKSGVLEETDLLDYGLLLSS